MVKTACSKSGLRPEGPSNGCLKLMAFAMNSSIVWKMPILTWYWPPSDSRTYLILEPCGTTRADAALSEIFAPFSKESSETILTGSENSITSLCSGISCGNLFPRGCLPEAARAEAASSACVATVGEKAISSPPLAWTSSVTKATIADLSPSGYP